MRVIVITKIGMKKRRRDIPIIIWYLWLL